MIQFAPRAAAVVVSLMLAGSAFAQTPAAAPTPAAKSTPAAAPADKKAEKPRTEASLECSKQADAKGLHGKKRKSFQSACKKAGGKAN